MGVFLQGCWHILWVVHLMGDQRASWPDDVVFAIIYLPAAGKCRLNSNNYGKCHLERMMGLCSDGSPGWWVISTEVEEGLGGPFEQPRWCEALRVYLSTSLYVTPLPLPRQIIANPTIGISSQLTHSHTLTTTKNKIDPKSAGQRQLKNILLQETWIIIELQNPSKRGSEDVTLEG